MNITRRSLIVGLSGAASLSALGLSRVAAAPVTVDLAARPTRANLTGPMTEGMMSYADMGPGPVIRLRQGQPALIRFQNRLDEMTTVHWHGVRVPHAMDGVAWVTQFPLNPGETYDYAFTPQDAGTFWYHPHCNTFAQLSRGLNGVLIVEEAQNPGFDAEVVVNLRDFRLGADGQFIELSKARYAARGGTLGTVMTANWAVEPALPVPPGGIVRLRLVNTDVTRVHRLFLPGTEGRVLALDGHPLEAAVPWPATADTALWVGPGQRADLALRGPNDPVDLMTDTAGGAKRLAQLVPDGPNLGHSLNDMSPLPPNPVSQPDLAVAETLDFVFGWSPDGNATGASSLCGDDGKRFWSINRVAGAVDGPDPGAPLATLRLGGSYRLRLRNETQNDHPIHLHGLTFRVLRSDRRALVPQWTDTALLRAQETLEVALVADNPGDWVFHCHVIEHQKTGLSGFLRVI